jgi:hypothetical protein
MNDSAISAWSKLFRETPVKILAKALDKVTKGAKRMPTPGDLSEEVNKIYESLGGKPHRIEANPDCRECGGTGFRMVTRPAVDIHSKDSLEAARCECRTDDEQMQMVRASRRFVPGIGTDPETGEQVPVMIDKANGDTLFRPQHCPEGREFIAYMRSLKVQPESVKKADRRESRKQKASRKENPKSAPLG